MPNRDYPAVDFANGKIEKRTASLMPRWRLRRGVRNAPGPKVEYVYAFAMRNSPNWLVFWPGEWALIGDGEFISAFSPSNQEARDNLVGISQRRPPLMVLHTELTAS
tara:strand:- start:1123 stop:1443 length:321 start_codon:yes stop_codon:yes gene_type:complete